MRASFRKSYGGFETLRIVEVGIPSVGATEILVRVMASSVSRTDSGVLRGKPWVFRFFTGLIRPRFTATGTDFSGIVESVGASVSKFSVGDRVYGFRDTGLGSHVEYLAVDVKEAVLTIPESASFHDAVALTEGAFYAVNFREKVDLNSDSRVLVIGATGGIGSSLTQILAAEGIWVDVVAPAAHAELVSRLGAKTCFDIGDTAALESGEIYDVVFDSVGKSRFVTCAPAIKPGGAYLSSELGNHAENLYLPIVTKFFRKKKVLFPIPTDISGSLEQVRNLNESGKFSSVIDREFALEDISAAFEFVEKGQKVGTVVLTIS
ncbi:MAG: NAD(P)-dependent alcohol dehydrogenase [Candidatus Nanopelagicales bacterium]|mgnify:FL=1|jgi:NADPH:quinone reductase-like Zn-dependent oxidoreductase|nr:NAD(P)-dependent alcohol dehydrogenase [Candidatus Nanopelagicales bacterium]